MTKKLREFIEKAKPYIAGTPIINVHIIPNGKNTGPFRGNGYESVILVGEGYMDDENLYLLNSGNETDMVSLFLTRAIVHGIDVPKKTHCARLMFCRPVIFTDEVLFSAVPEPYEKVN